MTIQSFEPIVDKHSRMLVLGTMPSLTSLNLQQYYAHEDNLFWDIIFRICLPEWKVDEVVKVDYNEKVALALRFRIAIWDVLKYCDRKGNLDRHIRNHARNDFMSFFKKYPSIDRVYFNGLEAERFFLDFKEVDEIFNERKFFSLPSTSSSYTMNAFRKLNIWKTYIDEGLNFA
jgi:hypoxanthine-DNA glycosylase